MIVGGKVGGIFIAIKHANIEVITIKRGNAEIELYENENLNVSQKIKVKDKLGHVLTESGKAKKIRLFKDQE